MKQVTIKDIAKEAGVSIASVSRALNGAEGISEKSRNRILEVCERCSYTPNGLARSLVKKKTQTLGIIFRDLNAEEQYIKLLVENQVEGILVFPIGSASMKSLAKYQKNVPMVSLNELPEGCGIPYVCADEMLAGKLATEYLISKGCKNLLFVGFKAERLAHRKRAESFLATAKKNRIPAQLYECNTVFRSSFERGYDHFKRFLTSGLTMPDGIVAASDATANGIIKACRENGIRIPEDFSLIGFDNITFELPYIELTTVAISHEKQAETAVETLIDMAEGRQLSKAQMAVKLEPKLVERKSCKG